MPRLSEKTCRFPERSIAVPGAAISLRLVIARVVDPKSGEILSTWYLLTNVPRAVSAERMALWYYWRWEIESFFKLLKSGGQQLEHWQQESGAAIGGFDGVHGGLEVATERR